MRAAEPLLLIVYRVEILLRRGREKALVLNESDTGVQDEKIRRHYDERREKRYCHFAVSSLVPCRAVTRPVCRPFRRLFLIGRTAAPSRAARQKIPEAFEESAFLFFCPEPQTS